MSTEKTNPKVSADVLIHNFGKKPNKEVKAKIMGFIEAHKEETMQLTEESLPAPDAPRTPTPEPDPLRSRHIRQKWKRPRPGDDGGSSSGEASPSS